MPKSKFVQWVERSITEVILEDLGDITNIGGYAFKGCSGLTSIVIPDSVTNIGNYVFQGCSGLTSITIPDGVTSIGFAAFISCSSLTSITIPDSVTNIGNYAFQDCSGLTEIEVAEGNTVYHSTGNCLIETNSKTLILGCKNSVIPTDDSVTSIGDSAFRGCNGLTSIMIPDGVTDIDNSAFSNCRGLTSITFFSSVTSLGGSACYNCSSLINITALSVIPPTIQSSTFTNVPATCTITVPYQSVDAYKSAQYWSDRANYIVPDSWRDYYYLKMNQLSDAINTKAETTGTHDIDGMIDTVNSIPPNKTKQIIDRSVTTITEEDLSGITKIGASAFSSCTDLTSITIPDSVTSIGGSAFLGCTGLTSINIPDSVTSIGNNAFSECSGLVSLTIGNSVTSMGGYTFKNCTALTSITSLNTTPPTITSSTFSSVPTSIPVYVPASAVSTYQSDQYWSNFTNIQAIPST